MSYDEVYYKDMEKPVVYVKGNHLEKRLGDNDLNLELGQLIHSVYMNEFEQINYIHTIKSLDGDKMFKNTDDLRSEVSFIPVMDFENHIDWFIKDLQKSKDNMKERIVAQTIRKQTCITQLDAASKNLEDLTDDYVVFNTSSDIMNDLGTEYTELNVVKLIEYDEQETPYNGIYNYFVGVMNENGEKEYYDSRLKKFTILRNNEIEHFKRHMEQYIDYLINKNENGINALDEQYENAIKLQSTFRHLVKDCQLNAQEEQDDMEL